MLHQLLTLISATPTQLPITVGNWTTIVGAGIITLINTAISGMIGWWITRPKKKADLFAAFMSESSDFREELRKERKFLKDELERVTHERDVCHQTLKGYQG